MSVLLKLSPNYANAHHWFGDGPLMAMAMTDRSIAEEKRSVELDPLSLINNADLAGSISTHAATTKRRRRPERRWKWIPVFIWRVTMSVKPSN